MSNDSMQQGSVGDINSDLKSPISLVYEIALKRNLSVIFEVLSEKVSFFNIFFLVRNLNK